MKNFLKIIPFFTLLQIGACQFLTDLSKWDLSACFGSGFDTCYELFFDNKDLIFGGQTIIETTLSF